MCRRVDSAGQRILLCLSLIHIYMEKPLGRLEDSTIYTWEYVLASPVEKLYTFTVTEKVLEEFTNRRLFSATHFVNSSRTFSVTVKAVSYTHLDVYKRQFIRFRRPVVYALQRRHGKSPLKRTLRLAVEADL